MHELNLRNAFDKKIDSQSIARLTQIFLKIFSYIDHSFRSKYPLVITTFLNEHRFQIRILEKHSDTEKRTGDFCFPHLR